MTSIKRKAPHHIALVTGDKALWFDSHSRRYSVAWHAGFNWDTYVSRGVFTPADAANVLAVLDTIPATKVFPDYIRHSIIPECKAAMRYVIAHGAVACHSAI